MMIKVILFNGLGYDFDPELTKDPIGVSTFVCRSEQEALRNIEDAEVLVTFRCTEEMLRRAKKLRWIQMLSAGVDGLPMDDIRARGIILTNGRGIHRVQMSEYVIWAMISLARNVQVLFRDQQRAIWGKGLAQGEIYGATAGILGLGSIGREVAQKASTLGMHVIGAKRSPEKVDFVEKVWGAAEMGEVFKNSDYVINLLPHTKKTDRIIDGTFFDMMKESGCFINIGRGGTVNEEDLIKALQTHRIRGAVCDVYNQEPLPKDSPLWKLDNVILTPHICGSSPKYMEKAMQIVEYNLHAYLNGKKMINVIDFNKGY